MWGFQKEGNLHAGALCASVPCEKCAKLVAALKAVAQRKLKDGTFCWCAWMGYSVEDVHYPFCKQARAVLKELGE